MRYALFLGCQVPGPAPQYERATRQLLKRLGVNIKDVEFNCCGYPMRHLQFQAYLLAAARNLALAESHNLPMVVLCKCCLGSFKHAQEFLRQDPAMREEVNRQLALEGLSYQGRAQVKHLQSVLAEDVGLERLSDLVSTRLQGLRIATMYGCHALRPSKITGFDNAYDPHLIEDLLQVTGVSCVDWAGRLKCCGASLRENNPDLSLEMISLRLKEFRESGADVLNVDCPHTLLQIKWAFEKLWPQSTELVRGVVLTPQLLGLAMDLSPSSLGLDENLPRTDFLYNYQAPAITTDLEQLS